MASTADARVLDLMMPMFSGTEDEYGTELVPPLPLSLDRVNGNRAPTSDAALFKLPFEILALILQHIPSHSLSSLALVNSDCERLARSAQFVSVTLNYSGESQLLVGSIVNRHIKRGPSNRFDIASCIRRITVATDPGYIQLYHQVGLDEDFANLDIETRDSMMTAASRAVFDTYFSLIHSLVCNPVIFPHLELLNWEDKVELPKSFFDALPNSNIQHLKLFRASIAQDFKLTSSSSLAQRKWPLRSLHLEIQPNLRGPKWEECSISLLCHDILRLCASTLESLTWTTQLAGSVVLDTFAADDVDPPEFSRLRYLELSRLPFGDSVTLKALVHDGLRVLNVELGRTKIEDQFFSTRGHVPDLRVLIWRDYSGKHLPVEFIRSNSQLSKLTILDQLPMNKIEDELLPILSGSFHALASLHLSWESDCIPESSLMVIGTLKTLRQLHLTAGFQYGWRHTWLINHNTMLKALSSLESLERLAFSRDTYRHKTYSWPSTERYYSDMIVDLEHAGERAETAWEEMHRDRMLREADKYIWEMPNLVWLYLGQLPMEVKTRPDGSRWPVSSSAERDDCWTLLRQMFGWKEGEKMWKLAMLPDEKL